MNGLLVVDKPSNISSRDVVNEIVRKFENPKVGHTGTLDPMATGVLVLAIGRGTKIVDYLTNDEKEYIAECKVGVRTDTLDTTGSVLETNGDIVNEDDLKRVIPSFKKTYMQEVPAYSAIHVNGVRSYELARSGKKVELPKRKVTIKDIELLDFSDKSFKIKVTVSKGTYIRSLIDDICDELNVIGVMSSLRRTRQGIFTIEEAIKLEDININTKLINLVDAFNYPKIEITEEIEKQVMNGAMVENKYNITDKCLFVKGNKLIAIYEVNGNYLKVLKMILEK